MSHTASRFMAPLLLAAIFVGACFFAEAHAPSPAPVEIESSVARAH
jgi:hypothetical protein